MPNRSYQGRGGYNNWIKPGAFNNGFFGCASVLVFSASRSSGLDLISLGAPESTKLPEGFFMASKCSFWTLTVLRLLSALVTGLQAPYTDLRLLGASSYLDVAASPISIAMADRDTPRMGLKALTRPCGPDPTFRGSVFGIWSFQSNHIPCVARPGAQVIHPARSQRPSHYEPWDRSYRRLPRIYFDLRPLPSPICMARGNWRNSCLVRSNVYICGTYPISKRNAKARP